MTKRAGQSDEERALVRLAAAMGGKVEAARARLAAAGRSAVDVVAELDRRASERERQRLEIAAAMQADEGRRARQAIPTRGGRKDKRRVPTGWRRDKRFGALMPAWAPEDIIAAIRAVGGTPTGNQLIPIVQPPTLLPTTEARALAGAVAAGLTEARPRPLAQRHGTEGPEHPLTDPAFVATLRELHWRLYGYPLGHEWIGTLIAILSVAAQQRADEDVRRDHGGAEPMRTFELTPSTIIKTVGAPPGSLTLAAVGAMLRRVTLHDFGRNAAPARVVVREWWEKQQKHGSESKSTRPKQR